MVVAVEIRPRNNATKPPTIDLPRKGGIVPVLEEQRKYISFESLWLLNAPGSAMWQPAYYVVEIRRIQNLIKFPWKV